MWQIGITSGENLNRAGLEFRDHCLRIQCIVGQEICGRLGEVYGNEHDPDRGLLRNGRPQDNFAAP